MTEFTNSTTDALTDQTDWTALTTSERRRHLELEGYVVLPDLIPAEQLSRIRDEVDRLPTVPTDYSEHQRGCPDVQWTDSPACIDLIALPETVRFLSTVFGDELICTRLPLRLVAPRTSRHRPFTPTPSPTGRRSSGCRPAVRGSCACSTISTI